MKPKPREFTVLDEAVRGYLRMLLLVFGLVTLAVVASAIQNCGREDTDRSGGPTATGRHRLQIAEQPASQSAHVEIDPSTLTHSKTLS